MTDPRRRRLPQAAAGCGAGLGGFRISNVRQRHDEDREPIDNESVTNSHDLSLNLSGRRPTSREREHAQRCAGQVRGRQAGRCSASLLPQ